MTANLDLLDRIAPAENDPPVFILLASPTWAPWLPDTAYQKVPIGVTGQVLTVNADGSMGWQNSASGFANPMTTNQDLIVGGTSGLPTRLPIGSNGQVLTDVSGVIAWASPVTGFTNPMTTTGDIIIATTGGTAVRLAAGTPGQGLVMSGSFPAWSSAVLLNPMTTSGDLILGAAGGSPTRLGAGTSGFLLTSQGPGNQPIWAPPGPGFANPMTTNQDLIVGGTGGSAGRLAVGTNGQVLGVSSGAVGWVNNPAGFTNPMTQPQDLIVGGIGGAGTRLPAGSSGQVLSIVGGAVEWAATSGTPVIQPTGDTSGAQDTLNIQTALNLNGVATINTAAGPFYVGTSGSATAGLKVPTPGGWLNGTVGAGLVSGFGSTAHPIYYLGTGTAISMLGPPNAGSPHAYPSNIMGGQITNVVIDGSMAGGSAVGITYGNGDSFYLNRVRVSNFGGIGLHEVSNATGAYTEKVDINAQVFYCTIGHQFDSLGAADNSHFYGRWNIHVEGCTIGCQFINSAGIHGGKYRMFGNFYTQAVGGANGIGIDFSAGVNNSGHFDTSDVTFQCETTAGGSGGPWTFQTVRFGTNVNAGFNNCTGDLLFADTWTSSDLSGFGQMQFGGYINNGDLTLTTWNGPAPFGWLTLSGTQPVGVAPGGYTGPLNTNQVMAGLTETFTPTGTGTLLAYMSCGAATDNAATTFTISARHGTGSVPTAGQTPAVGSRINATGDYTRQSPAAGVPVQVTAMGIINATVGVAQWFDFAIQASNGADPVQIFNPQVVVVEF